MTATATYDQDTEKNLIGAVLVDPKCMVELRGLAPEDFCILQHSAIWQAIRDLDADQRPVDQMTIAAEMQTTGTMTRLNSIGGAEYLTQLTASIITFESLGYHARRLRQMSKRRQWIAYARKLVVQSADPAIDTDDFLEQAERAAMAMSVHDDPQGGPRHISAVLKDLRRTLDARSDNRSIGGISGIAAGFAEIDRMTLGFQPGDLIVLAARPSMGKTALVCNIVANVVADGTPALVFSLEMSDQSLAERMVARDAPVAARTLRTGRLNQSDWQSVARSMSEMSQRPLEIDERGGIDIRELRSTAQQWRARQKKAGLVVVDYMQLIASSATANKNQNREREVAEQSRALKLLAKEIKCPVIALSQLSRALESRSDKRPMLSDLRESGAIEQDADTVAFIYREVVYDPKTTDPDAAEVVIAKQRNGQTGTAMLRWNGLLQKFSDVQGGQ